MTAKLPTALKLDERYTLQHGRAYLSGAQALVRLPMLQKLMDRRAGLHTAGFVSGYRGSPLAGLDQQFWQAQKHLTEHDIVFQAGLNEDLAATAVWGTQQVNLYPNAKFDGVFGMWYGKGPGADRSTDAIKHANFAGTSQHGGVLMVVGDDHAAKSSSIAHQSEHLMAAAGVPVLYPSNVQEILDFGLHGWAMSRFAGLWAGLKCVTQVVETSASIELDPERVKIILPTDVDIPADGLHIRWPDPPLAQEERMLKYKWYAAVAYVRANQLNQIVLDAPQARLGIMTAGKAYQDVRQALEDLGLDRAACRQIGLRLMKVACVWPLNAHDAREFALGLDEILVIEEKRQILEYALKEELYNWRDDVRPKVYGKFDARDNAGGEWAVPHEDWLLPPTAEFSPAIVAKAIAKRLLSMPLPEDIRRHILERIQVIEQKERETARPRVTAERQPWFCSGCPHNTSTRVPDGSRAMAGIGCHYMAHWMDRNTSTFSHMGGEGIAWLGQTNFTSDKHIFVNLGDGTYFHSGILAIRAAIAAKANITYKILFNDAVAMTGGQPVDGTLTVGGLVAQMLAEGVSKIVVVTDHPEAYQSGEIRIPASIDVVHRDNLDKVQRELRDIVGTTVLVYQQMCATEKRRRRKRGLLAELNERVIINPEVCEACGDCSKVSNCLSIEPLETNLGTKRRINQSSCNQDFSCVKGFCPSFVTVKGAKLRKPDAVSKTLNEALLPEPSLPDLTTPYRILITGVGGTGIVTIGAVLGMAAHLEGKGVSVLDMAGLAQKGGAVLSHVQIAAQPSQLNASKIATGEAKLLLGCDAIVAASTESLNLTRHGLTHAVINSSETPTASFIKQRTWAFPSTSIAQDINASMGDTCQFLDANQLALQLLGDTVFANLLLMGYAWQKGYIPLRLESLMQTVELNAVQVEKNKLAFHWGRYLAHHGQLPAGLNQPEPVIQDDLDSVLNVRKQWLTEYQDEAYAARYLQALQPLREAEARLGLAQYPLTRIAAKQLAHLMAYKDEYEVARLYSTPQFKAQLAKQFEGEAGKDYQLQLHLAPSFLSRNAEDAPRKWNFNGWILRIFPYLARLKQWRGTKLDILGYSAERQQERALREDYLQLIRRVAQHLSLANQAQAETLLNSYDEVRGFGHVKAASIARVSKKQASLWADFLAK
ncbi:indolepyruvate ferredoxin oxidoreductase family protein [Thiolinea disciformis]|uniref:indolepyruvate ferredoxin oxidoreductase family protein n=1 Tax=Thiolinea disciformis TaxID=125614 RepID=UPI00037C6771|nr:indolepyruvate ferredoxin oxidoreductase family protein [Thiolinea disciformis]